MSTASEPKGECDVKVDRHGPVTVLTLSYPERRNALALALRARLLTELETALDDADCRVIVLTGAGAHFCSGGDITSFEGVTPARGRSRMQFVHRIMRLLIRGEKPVIAAVEGHAAGAGMCLAAACDIVVASTEAKFSCTFNRIGLLPDLAGLWSIPNRIGMGRARYWIMSGRVMDAASAQAQGMAEELCAPGSALETALALAQEVAQVSPLSNGMVKSVLARGPMPLEDLMSAETDAQAVLFGTEDFQEGRKAFLAKRKPEFRGR